MEGEKILRKGDDRWNQQGIKRFIFCSKIYPLTGGVLQVKRLSISLLIMVLAVSLSSAFAFAQMYKEAPELAAMVRAGNLPPVEQRLPKEPFVAEWSDEDGSIGKYGGILRRATWDPGLTTAIRDITRLIGAKHSWTADAYPNVAKSYRMADGGREWTIVLREGLKWSDGQPYTVDDIMFWYEDIQLNEEVSPNPYSQLRSGGEIVKFEKVNDYTLRIKAKEPYLLENNTGLLYFVTRFPKHYLKGFHARYIGKDKADQMAKDAGFDSWSQLLLNKADHHERSSTEKPSLEPWVLAQAPPADPVIFKRNPYYWAVDKEGNQLPYIDEMRYTMVGDAEVIKLKALAGEADYSTIEDMITYPLFKSAEKAGQVKVFRWASTAINAAQVEFNLTHKDPVMREIFLDKRFRFAVSHAINRKMISELVWLGLAEPWQAAPYETSRFYNERLAKTGLEHNPVKANKMLDEVGLDKKDSNGWRLRPDGKKLEITFISFPTASLPQIGEIVMDNLKSVGISVNLRFVDFGFLIEQKNTNSHDAALIWQTWGTNEGVYLAGDANHLLAVRGLSFWAPEWVNWYQSGGEKGEKPVPEMIKAMEAYDKAKSTFDPAEQERWFKVVTDVAADNLWVIGTTKQPGFIKVISPKLRNVPQSFLSWHRGDWGRPDIWFYED